MDVERSIGLLSYSYNQDRPVNFKMSEVTVVIVEALRTPIGEHFFMNLS